MLRTTRFRLAVVLSVGVLALVAAASLPRPSVAQGTGQYLSTTGRIWIGFEDPRPHVHVSAHNQASTSQAVMLRIRNSSTGGVVFEDGTDVQPGRAASIAVDCAFIACGPSVTLEVEASTDAMVPSGLVLLDPAAGEVTGRYLTPADFTLFAPDGTPVRGAVLGVTDQLAEVLAEMAALRAELGALTQLLGAVNPTKSTVFLARSDIAVDALGAGAQAAQLGAPVLVTPPNQLDEDTAGALLALAPDLVVVAGGPAAISEDVVAAVAALLPDAEILRVAGPTRTGTAAELAALPGQLTYGRPVLRGR